MSARVATLGLALLGLAAAGAGSEARAEAVTPAARADAVTPADARKWLRAQERALAREDLAGALALVGTPELERALRYQLEQLFEARNYLKAEHRILETAPREDGSLEVEALRTLRSRLADRPSDVQEKLRLRQRLARRDGRVVAVEALPARRPLLPVVGRWAPEEWTGRVSLEPEPLRPFGSPEGRARIEVRVRLRNVSPGEASELAFGLHPFASDVSLRAGAAGELAAVRHEGVADVWQVELPEPVPAGAALRLELAYELHQVGDGLHARIAPDGAHLFPEAAWLPVFAPPPVSGTERATHDLSVEVPAGWTATVPGVLAQESELPNGRRSLRWFSRFPSKGLALVAGELERSEHRLTESLALDLWRQPGRGPAPASLLEAARSMAAHLEGLLGPAPAERVAIVEYLGEGMRQQPGWFVLANLRLEDEELYRRDREREPRFFLAHHLAHLWMVDSARPLGGPAEVLTEALCDHLAFDWLDEEVDPGLSEWHRRRITEYARSKPDDDGPLLAAQPEQGVRGLLFGYGKALVVLDGYREFAGRELWASALRGHAREHRGRQVGVGEIIESLTAGNARLENYVGTWIVGEGWADIVVHEPTARERIDGADGERRYEVAVEIANEGLGPVPVLVRTLEDRPDAQWREHRLELGTHSTTVLRFEARAPLLVVDADPRYVTWQDAVRNDAWPERKRKPKSLPGQQRKLTEEDQARLEKLLRD